MLPWPSSVRLLAPRALAYRLNPRYRGLFRTWRATPSALGRRYSTELQDGHADDGYRTTGDESRCDDLQRNFPSQTATAVDEDDCSREAPWEFEEPSYPAFTETEPSGEASYVPIDPIQEPPRLGDHTFANVSPVHQPYQQFWWNNYVRARNRYSRDRKETWQKAGLPVLSVQTSEWVEAVLEQLKIEDAQISLQELAMRFDTDASELWNHLTLWLVSYDPEQTIPFLRATKASFLPPHPILRNALFLLALRFIYIDAPETLKDPDLLADFFCDMVMIRQKQDFYVGRQLLWFIIKRCGHTRVLRTFQLLRYSKARVPWNTYLHFASHFAKQNCYEQALEALAAAIGEGAAVNSYAVRSTSSTILRKSIEQPDGLRASLHLVEELNKIGVTLDGDLRDIIILNAVDAGDAKTAFSVHESLMAEGLQPTAKTFHNLLRACQIDLSDAEMLNKIIRSAIAYGVVRRSPLVAGTILWTLALHHWKYHPTSAYQTLVDAYSEIFDPHSLKQLKFPWPSQKRHDDTASPLILPSSEAMVIMLQACVFHLVVIQRNPRALWPIYQSWRTFAEAGQAPYTILARTDHWANAFLMAFAVDRNTQEYSSFVIDDMLHGVSSRQTQAGYPRARPTLKSWTIYLRGFARRRDAPNAENAMQRMRAEGIEPDALAWNSLVNAYARSQRVHGARDALLRMKAAGIPWDEGTVRCLDKLKNRDQLFADPDLQGLWRGDLDFSPELKVGLAERVQNADLFEVMEDAYPSPSLAAEQDFTLRDQTGLPPNPEKPTDVPS